MFGRALSSSFAAALVVCLVGRPGLCKPLCIQDNLIDHTEITDDQTILFHMIDGSVFKNRLPQRCVGLKNATNGFTFEPTDPGSDELCGDLGMFHVNEGPGLGFNTGQVCNFGEFTQIAGPRGAPMQH